MQNLRYGIGDYIPNKKSKKSQKLAPLGLTLPELGELLRRAGREAGFIVESEYKVQIENGGNVKKIDWVWLSPSTFTPIVAIEIEGQGVPLKSIANDISKFKKCEALWNVIVLFQVDHDRTVKPPPARKHKLEPKKWVAGHVAKVDDSFAVDILLDEDLMKSGGIERFQRKVIEHHNPHEKTKIKSSK